MRFRAPSFTDTSGGGGELTGEEDVRYFSVSVGGLLTTMTSRTINDSELVIDDEGELGAPGGILHDLGIHQDALRRQVI